MSNLFRLSGCKAPPQMIGVPVLFVVGYLTNKAYYLVLLKSLVHITDMQSIYLF